MCSLRTRALATCAAAALLALKAFGAPGDEHPVHLFPAASDASGREGFVRVVNHSAVAGEVEIRAYDDAGRGYGPATLSLGAGAAAHFNSGDLENGNAAKGLAGDTGPGEGDWRLVLTSALDIEVLAYVRTADGFLTSMHDAAPAAGNERRVAVFNPGSNVRQVSLLRLANAGAEAAAVTITGVDDAGRSPGPGASATVPAGGALTFTAAELESGGAAGLSGSIGDGEGKWRLVVETDAPVAAQSLLSSPAGHLTNLSTVPGGRGGRHAVALFPPASDAPGRQGFARVTNRSDRAGEVEVRAWDDAGRGYGPATLALAAGRTAHFNSADLEDGNAAKGLSGGTGPGPGDWRLELASDLELEVLAYVRTADGFLTAMHDTVPRLGRRHRVAMFNPGSNTAQESLLRLANPGSEDVSVSITGVDDAGLSPGTAVVASVPARGALTLSALDLESGGGALAGAMGDGKGKWRLAVRSDRPVLATSLLSSPTGHLTNLSTAPGRGAGPPETAEEVFEARVSPVVQSQCVNCHVAGGESGGTRLVFATTTAADHLAENLAAFARFLAEVEGGAAWILYKIEGGLGHGGGVQVAAGSAERRSFGDFLARLRAERSLIEGTAYRVGTSPLAEAECEFAAVASNRLGPGERLAAGTADADGAFAMLAPAETDGFLACRPPGLARAALLAFDRSGVAGGSDAGHVVSPESTVEAATLAAEAVRNPGIDLGERAAALAGSLAGDGDFALLADAAAGLFGVLEERGADIAYFELLLDAFGNGRIDNPRVDPDLATALDDAVARAELAADRRAYTAAARTFLDLPMLADANGLDDPAPPPPLAADPTDLADLADGFRTAEFVDNPALYYLNAHWAYARGLDGAGEVIGMVDTGIYAAHEEFAERLHDETVYTVIGDDTDGDGWPQFSYFKIGEKDPATAYPEAAPDPDDNCRGVYCKFYYYHHGTLMASLAGAARNGEGAHGTVVGAKTVFRPTVQSGSLIGGIYYHPPGPITQPHLISRHQVVRRVGDIATVVSNSWLTGTSAYWADPAPGYLWPFHQVLTPRYVPYQRDRRANEQAILLWAAGNRPESAGPLVDGAAVPSVSERQLRALSGGERGLADLLLTDEERTGISAPEALRRAELALAALRRRWLVVVAFPDSLGRVAEFVDCIQQDSTEGDCKVNWTVSGSARCGYASDWCVGTGPGWGGLWLSDKERPEPTGQHGSGPNRTSEATALASGAVSVLLHAYRDENSRLAVPAATVLKRLGATARRDIIDPEVDIGLRSWSPRNVLLREEDMVRSLIRYAGASDDGLRELIDTARAELNGNATDGGDDEGPDADDRLRVLNRFVPYFATIDTESIRELLNAAEADPARARDLLAQLIRQIEWIDEQLRRRGIDKDTATDDDVRDIAITSLVGHGLIDLKAATDPGH